MKNKILDMIKGSEKQTKKNSKKEAVELSTEKEAPTTTTLEFKHQVKALEVENPEIKSRADFYGEPFTFHFKNDEYVLSTSEEFSINAKTSLTIDTGLELSGFANKGIKALICNSKYVPKNEKVNFQVETYSISKGTLKLTIHNQGNYRISFAKGDDIASIVIIPSLSIY